MGKIKETRQLYKEVLSELSKSTKNWTEFLDSSSWNFKYDFDDQILIYAQRPDAKACATIEEWNNKLKRWVNGGTKPIYIFDKNPYSEYPFKLVFDLSDTHNYNNTEYKLWSIKQEYEEDIIDSLEASFGDITSKGTLSQAIVLASYNMVVDNMEDYLTSVINNKSNSMLENISDEEIRNIFMTTAWASVSYMMMTRCGINAKEQIQEQDLSYISYFNNQEVLTTLGASVSDIAEMGLREIAKTVTILQKKENLKNRTFVKNDNEMYDKDNEKIKGGIEDGRENRVHETGRVLYAEPNNEERENTTRKILSNEIQLSKEPQELRINNISDGTEVDGAFDRNTGTSNEESREDSRENEETRGNNGRIESSRPDEMGSTHEQHQDDSRGDSSEGTNLHLSIYTRDSDRNCPYIVTDDKLNQLLSITTLLKVSNSEIIKYFQNEKDTIKRAEFLKNSFNIDYTELIINDNERYGYKSFENGLLSWRGSFSSRDAETLTSWEELTEHYQSMILLNQLRDITKKLPTVTDQMSLINDNENKPELEFSQEFIDRVLQERGTTSKYDIYRQFESSLSLNDNADYLKRLYGNTYYGTSHTITGSGIGLESSPKGMTLYRGYFKNRIEITLSWNNVAKRIEELIKADRYLNSKEKEEYTNWLKKQEQERELREAEKKFEDQAKKQEDELAERVYSFVKPFEIYNYPDSSIAENTDEENIEIVKADINDAGNVIDYVNALKNVMEKMEDTNPQKHEVEVLLSILEKRVPHYEYHLGDTVYIGADEYEIAAINDNSVTLYDVKFPMINKQMDFEEFERKVRDNYANDHLKVENKNITELEDNKNKLSNIVEKDIKEEKQIEQKQEVKQEIKEEKPYKVGQEVYLESDRKYKIDKIDLENEKISLLDLQINYPIFREESILTFENLYYQNERNQPKESIKPNFVKTSNKIQDFILHPEVALKDRNNYKITDNNLGIGTPREKFERNIEAIKVLKKCEQENRYATPEEQEILSKYVGWGGLPQAFEENNSSWSNEYNILKDLLNEDEYKNARSSTLTAFYTPPIVINAMYEILQNMGLKEANILEPSCRSWKFFRYATK